MNQQDSPRGGVGGVGVGCPRPAPFPALLPGSTSRRAPRRFLGGGCGQRRRRTAGLRRRVCVAGPCGAGEGARAAQTMPAGAEPAAGPPSALTLLRFFFLLSPPPRPLYWRGGDYILMPLGCRSSRGSDGLAAVALRGRCGVWFGSGELRRRPGDLNVSFPPAPPLPSWCAGGRGAAGWTPSPQRPLPSRASPSPWARAGEGTACASLSCRARRCPEASAAGVWLALGVRWPCAGRAAVSSYGLCARSRRRQEREAEGLRGRTASLQARPPGSRARPRTLFSFSGLFVPLSVLCHPPKRETQTKESLYFFSELVK